MIIDSGAETSVIGAGWKITHYYGRTVNLVGFDSEYARKKNLSLVSAETVVVHPTEGPHLLRIHQAVYNPTAKCTLLSEYQLSEAGCSIDAKHTKHKYLNGEAGTQCIKFPNSSLRWKLDINSCLFSLRNRGPSLEESQTLPPIDITKFKEWDPTSFTDGISSIKEHNEIVALAVIANDEDLLKDTITEKPTAIYTGIRS